MNFHIHNEPSSSSASVNLEMAVAFTKSNKAVQDAKPKNTKKAYQPRIAEFKAWCDEKFFHEPAETRYTIFGQKAHLFLFEQVNSRSIRRRRGRKIVPGASGKKVKLATLEQYAAAIVSYWRKQKLAGVNNHDHPRIAFTSLLEKVRLEEEKAKRSNFEDRGIL
ncbi:hypothetical protein G6F56_012073 [Rhizopus delemar]|nr:hypothetical protein G6F56_012073 [Rhizopus delemar]